MFSAIGLDLFLVITLELTRGAIETTLFKPLLWTQYVHISASLIAVILYFFQISFGLKLRKSLSDEQYRKMHKRIGLSCFAFRSIGFIFVYSMISK
jgi:hypothetical protein